MSYKIPCPSPLMGERPKRESEERKKTPLSLDGREVGREGDEK